MGARDDHARPRRIGEERLDQLRTAPARERLIQIALVGHLARQRIGRVVEDQRAADTAAHTPRLGVMALQRFAQPPRGLGVEVRAFLRGEH